VLKSSRTKNLGGVAVEGILQHGSLRSRPLVDMSGGRIAMTAGLVNTPLVPDGQIKRDRNRRLVAKQNGTLAGHQFVAVGINLAEFHREYSLAAK